jgi:hypothetical protein
MIGRPWHWAARMTDTASPSQAALRCDLGEALGVRLKAELDRAHALLGWRGGRIHAGVHEARKSLRRARGMLALAASLPGGGAALIDRELRRICDSLSALRDAQALVEVLDRLSVDQPLSDQRPLLRRARRIAAAARAQAAAQALAADPGLIDRRGRLAVLSAGSVALPWRLLTEDHVHGALADSLDAVVAAAARARKTGSDLDWHRWRRRLRRLKQQRTALGGLPVALDATADRLEGRAVALGHAQDFALLGEHCGKRSVFDRADRKALRTLARRGLKQARTAILAESAG